MTTRRQWLQTSANGNLQVEIWYLNEAGIAAATAGAVWCHDFIVTWSGAPINERFVAFTLKDVNQVSPVRDFDGANNASATTIAAAPSLRSLSRPHNARRDFSFGSESATLSPAATNLRAQAAPIALTAFAMMMDRPVTGSAYAVFRPDAKAPPLGEAPASLNANLIFRSMCRPFAIARSDP